jgi:hypothetical protein
MDSKEIIKKLTKMRQDIDDILIELEPPKECVKRDWLKNEEYGWLIFRSGLREGYGWNPNGKWVDRAGWTYAFDSGEWKKADKLEVVQRLVSEGINRYGWEEIDNLEVDAYNIILDSKVVFTTITGEWLKDIRNES